MPNSAGGAGGAWCLDTGNDFLPNHLANGIDYGSIHMWPDNWGRTDLGFGKTWLQAHIDDVKYLGKPLVLEEFGKAVGELLASPSAQSKAAMRGGHAARIWLSAWSNDSEHPNYNSEGLRVILGSCPQKVPKGANQMLACSAFGICTQGCNLWRSMVLPAARAGTAEPVRWPPSHDLSSN